MNTDQLLKFLETEGIDIARESLYSALHPTVTDSLSSSFRMVHADEGTVWLLDIAQEKLIPVWNSGATASQVVGHYWQFLHSGLISLACVAEQSLCENFVYENDSQNRTLDRRLKKLTCAMIAIPLRLSSGIVGVVSCVRLKEPEALYDPPAFSTEDLAIIIRAVEEVQPQIDAFIAVFDQCPPQKLD